MGRREASVQTSAALGSQREPGWEFGGAAAGDVWVFAGMRRRRRAPGTFLQGPPLTCQRGRRAAGPPPGSSAGVKRHRRRRNVGGPGSAPGLSEVRLILEITNWLTWKKLKP